MESNIEALSWWLLTKRIFFSPRVLFAEMPESISFQTSALYLAKTALAISLINALILGTAFFVFAESLATIFSAFTAIFGTLLTPLIAVVANMPPEKVPAAVDAFLKSIGVQVGFMTAKFAAAVFVFFFATIVACTYFQAAIAFSISRLLGGTGSLSSTAAVYAFGSTVWIFSLVPAVNVFTPIYGTALGFFGTRQVHKLPTAKALLSAVLTVVSPITLFALYSCMHN